MKIAILGFDIEGKASYEYFTGLDQDHELTICDQNPDIEVPTGAESALGEQYLDDLDRFDMLVRTAGLPPAKILAKNPGVADKITTHVNEFFRVCPTRNIIGVTGTKGKGTTSTLIRKMLEADGKQVFLGGNIGVPPLTFLSELDADSYVVLELSSFQLVDMRYSPHIGVCLMMAPEHLNWHADMQDYQQAKSHLFLEQTADDIAIYFAENALSRLIASAGNGRKVPYFEAPGAVVNDGVIRIDDYEICRTDELKLLGEHNWQNACAAVTAAWQVTQNVDAVRSVLTTFSGLEHRLELVREVDGVKYYDDSFGTTPETAIVAVQAFEQPKVIILGGSDKGASFEQLAATVSKGGVRQVLLIGETAPSIQAFLEEAGYLDFAPGGSTMQEIVAKARATARPGDVVLLSTGCASFDMFANYKDRGDQFKRVVRALAKDA